MNPQPIVVTVNVDGEHHAEMSVLATKLLIAAFGIIEGQPAAAAGLNVEWEGETHSMGAVLVADEELFKTLIATVDARYGKSNQKKTQMVLISELLKELGINAEELKRRLNDHPTDPRMN